MTVLVRLIVIIVLTLCYTRSIGQHVADKPPIITITDTQLHYTLADYIVATNAVVVAVFMERANNEYTYSFYNPVFYDFIEANPPTYWGRWKGRTILFYTGLESITQMQDSTAYKKLLIYVRPTLINQFSPPPTPEKPVKAIINGRSVSIVELGTALTGGGNIIWRLKVKDGKETSLEKSFDPVTSEHLHIDIPYINYRNRKRPSR